MPILLKQLVSKRVLMKKYCFFLICMLIMVHAFSNKNEEPLMSPLPSAEEVLDFWFGAPSDPAYLKPNMKWFRQSDAFDQEIVQKFGPLYEAARSGKLDQWKKSPKKLLAFIIVLDQFPRNMFRGSKKSFDTDAHALELAKQAVADGLDQQLAPMERSFLYLPYEHSEHLPDQEASLLLFADLPASDAAGAYEYAERHHKVIKRFGRFPHRNKLMGRTSTPEEVAFLNSDEAPF